MKNTKIFALTLLILLSAPFGAIARADRVGQESRAWVEEVRNAARAGELSYEAVEAASNTVPNAVKVRLLEISYDQAQIWADTILGGDYLAEEAVIIDQIELLRSGETLMGYRVTYSSLAYDTADCDPEGDLARCVPGRIVESSFVAPSLNAWIRDDRRYAEFVPSDVCETKN